VPEGHAAQVVRSLTGVYVPGEHALHTRLFVADPAVDA
jgi:hypothetical protein